SSSATRREAHEGLRAVAVDRAQPQRGHDRRGGARGRPQARHGQPVSGAEDVKRFTRDQALRETRALLGEQGAVKVITCSLGTGPGGVRRCSAIGIHDADCRGGAAAYVVGIKYEIGPVHLRTISHRGEGSTWEIALADAALHTHRLGCAACKSATKMADLCEHGRPLLDAFTRARTARFRLPNGRLSAAGLKAEAATRPGCVRLAYARSTGLLVRLFRQRQ